MAGSDDDIGIGGEATIAIVVIPTRHDSGDMSAMSFLGIVGGPSIDLLGGVEDLPDAVEFVVIGDTFNAGITFGVEESDMMRVNAGVAEAYDDPSAGIWAWEVGAIMDHSGIVVRFCHVEGRGGREWRKRRGMIMTGSGDDATVVEFVGDASQEHIGTTMPDDDTLTHQLLDLLIAVDHEDLRDILRLRVIRIGSIHPGESADNKKQKQKHTSHNQQI